MEVKEIVRAKVLRYRMEWEASGKTIDQRVKEARANGEIAKKVFDDPAVMPKIIEAIDSESQIDFTKACVKAGITDVDMIARMWDATMGSLDPQSTKPCW
jgi:hypothetical protein